MEFLLTAAEIRKQIGRNSSPDPILWPLMCHFLRPFGWNSHGPIFLHLDAASGRDMKVDAAVVQVSRPER